MKNLTIICVLVFLISTFFSTTGGQCTNNVGCTDCFDMCFTWRDRCNDSDQIVKNFCKRTCDACPSESSVCKALGCDHNCNLPSNPNEIASCSCFAGYTLDANGRSCTDINECLNEEICNADPNNSICLNTPGGYTCSGCSSKSGVWGYYERDGCCKRNAVRPSQCGYSATNGKIVRGRFAAVARWPWTTYISVDGELCGGSLITRDWVLTSAHCVGSNIPISRITVVLGVLNTTMSGNVHEQTFQVLQRIIHPQYSYPNHDIALLQLSSQTRLGRYVATVCLPQGEEPAIGEKCYATGYGTIEYRGSLAGGLQEVDLPIARNDLCVAAYANTSTNVNPNIHLCAGYESGGKDACQGDSGGPLVCQRCDNCDWYVAGIISFGVGCGLPGFYGVYTRVKYYENWIASITEEQVEQRECRRPTWHPWGPWTDCTFTCGTGTRLRVRSCLNGQQGEPDCFGQTQQSEDCNTNDCIVASWTMWASTDCSVTCGGGQMVLTRYCESDNDEGECFGNDRREEECNARPCPTWGEWQGWTDCFGTCGSGIRRSIRICNTNGYANAECEGESTSFLTCQLAPCNNWTDFSLWSSCSHSCGGGSRIRTRSCIIVNENEPGCDGDAEETEVCNSSICPYWTSFEYEKCSVTCGGGITIGIRECMNGQPGQAGCEGSEINQTVCNTEICPTWSDFEPLTNCSASCGGGVQVIVRQCNYGMVGDIGCHEGSARLEVACNTNMCPEWGSWSEFGPCSRTCGQGTQTRTRECNYGMVGDIGCHEGSARLEVACNTNMCPEWSSWSEFGLCSQTCGQGTQTRTRSCIGGPIGTGSCIGSSTNTTECFIANCSICGHLVDKRNDCRTSALIGYCATFYSYMQENCENACCRLRYRML